MFRSVLGHVDLTQALVGYVEDGACCLVAFTICYTHISFHLINQSVQPCYPRLLKQLSQG